MSDDATNTAPPASTSVQAQTETKPEAPPAPKPFVNRWGAKPAPKPQAQAHATDTEAVDVPGKRSKVVIPKRVASELGSLRSQVASVKATEKELGTYKEAVSKLAASAMSTLSQDERDMIVDLAGKDPRDQIRVFESLKARGKLGAPPPAVSKPSATTAPTSAPVAAQNNDPDILAFQQHAEAKKRGMTGIAAQLFIRNQAAIKRGEQKLNGVKH